MTVSLEVVAAAVCDEPVPALLGSLWWALRVGRGEGLTPAGSSFRNFFW